MLINTLAAISPMVAIGVRFQAITTALVVPSDAIRYLVVNWKLVSQGLDYGTNKTFFLSLNSIYFQYLLFQIFYTSYFFQIFVENGLF